MIDALPLLLGPEGYQINRSLRFRSSASAYLNRTPASAGDRQKFTISFWMKRGTIGTLDLFTGNNANGFLAGFRSDNTLYLYDAGAASGGMQIWSQRVFRDPSAWYHIVIAVDTTQATDSNRFKVYINGIQETISTWNVGAGASRYPSLNANFDWNNTNSHEIGYALNYGYFDGYLTEFNNVSGQSLPAGLSNWAQAFGETNPVTGVWQPKKYTGTYGTNGFYLNFADNTNVTNVLTGNTGIGKDSSGNGNYWSSNNISLYGGTVTQFTSVGTTSWTAPAGVTEVKYLVVAGGGGGGAGLGGGGGAGGFLTGTLAVTPGASYTVTVGAGGAGGPSVSENGSRGGNSVFASLTAIGGGGGQGYNDPTPWTPSVLGAGGSGGGSTNPATSGGSATAGQGNQGGIGWTGSGGLSSGNGFNTGGGGGAGGAGGNASGSVAGAGGIGIASSITGSSVYYAGGGAGGNDSARVNGPAAGGLGGGGSSNYNAAGSNGTANTGGGGGGGSNRVGGGNGYAGGSGGSGIVVISYGTGATYDSMIDVPTQWADGGNGRGNYAVLNPLSNGYGTTPIISITDGNLNFSDATSTSKTCVGSMTAPSGKWYFEMTCTNTGVYYVGLIDKATNNESWYRNNGTYSSSFGGGGTSGYSSWTTNDVIGVAWDVDAGKIWFAKNNTWQSGSPSAGTSPTNTFTAGLSLLPEIYTDNSAGTKSGSFNFGQRPFAYTPPSGFKALNTLNLPEPLVKKGADYFNAVTYAGNSPSSQSITVGFQPDMIWWKSRATAYSHSIADSSRGVTKLLWPNLTQAETTSSAGTDLVSFNSNGFTVGAANQSSSLNNDTSIVAWNWKEGATQGFDIVTYTGDGTTNRTVAHSLGVTPSMFIIKSRSAGTTNWIVHHKDLGNNGGSPAYLQYLFLESTAAKAASTSLLPVAGLSSTTFPTSGATNNTNVNGNGTTYVAYLFSEVAGFSRFGTYTGNGSTDGPFVFCGFRPRFLMFKRTDALSQWLIIDTARSQYNQTNEVLLPSTSAAEANGAGYGAYDILSNGFKPRNVVANDTNVNGGIYIFAAFAEFPFKNALAR